MWQRKQTIYFFLSALLIFAMPFSPLLEAKNNGNQGYSAHLKASIYELSIHHSGPLGPEETQSLIPLTVLLYGTALMLLIIIFQYKNRPLQIRLSRSLTLVLALVQASYLILMYRAVQSMGDTPLTMNYGWNIPIPAICAALVWLGHLGAKADEALVRAADRIR
jgi:hypothetical protein